jgi:hypothetical protein
MSCTLRHIPQRLHSNDRPIINEFVVGEEIYRRCKKEELENPFVNISIADVSVNRQGKPIEISIPEDVLINILECGAENYNLEICKLKIISLLDNHTFDKKFSEEKDGITHIAQMKLVHDPHHCMYPHCEFRVWLNNEHLTMSNFSDKLKKLKVIKAALRQELAKMIIQKEISQSAN